MNPGFESSRRGISKDYAVSTCKSSAKLLFLVMANKICKTCTKKIGNSRAANRGHCTPCHNTLLNARSASWRGLDKKDEPESTSERKPARDRILERDGYLCYYCGSNLRYMPTHLDHIYPKYLGGSDTASNIVTSCAPCNFKKSSKVEVDLINQALDHVDQRNVAFGIPSNLKIPFTRRD